MLFPLSFEPSTFVM